MKVRYLATRNHRDMTEGVLKTMLNMNNTHVLFEQRHEKTGFLHMRKQRRRSALRLPRS